MINGAFSYSFLRKALLAEGFLYRIGSRAGYLPMDKASDQAEKNHGFFDGICREAVLTFIFLQLAIK